MFVLKWSQEITVRFRDFDELSEEQLIDIKNRIGYIEPDKLPNGAKFLYNGPTGVLYKSTDDLVESAKKELVHYKRLSKKCGKDADFFISSPVKVNGKSENELLSEGIFGIYCSPEISPEEIIMKMDEEMPTYKSGMLCEDTTERSHISH